MGVGVFCVYVFLWFGFCGFFVGVWCIFCLVFVWCVEFLLGEV